MAKEEITPSEWQIMEVLWASDMPLTSSEVYKRMHGNVDMSMRMVRVLMNRLNQKDILGYTVDEHDSRVYHYYVLKQKQEGKVSSQKAGVEKTFLTKNQLDGLETELKRTGVAMETVQERYHIDDPAQMSEELYNKVMRALSRTRSAA